MVSISVVLCFIAFVFLMGVVLVASSVRQVREGTRLSVYRVIPALGQSVASNG